MSGEPPAPHASARPRLFLLAGVTVVVYALLYAPQPLLPLFSRRFGVSESEAALLVTLTLLPLSIAPLAYGYLLQRVAPARVLRASVLGLAILEAAFALSGSFPPMLAIRLLQGLLLPAALTALMTIVAATARPAEVQRAMSAYIAAAIVGGYTGRLIGGVAGAYLHWRVPFAALALLLFAGYLGLARLAVDPQPVTTQPPGRAMLDVLRDSSTRAVYAIAFCMFFVFAALLNFIPFRIAELEGAAGAWGGLIYTGYLLGVVTALGSGRIMRRAGGAASALLLGFLVYLAALAITLVPNRWVLFGALFGFCGAMFLIHAVATGVVNRRMPHARGVANGLYLVAYYGGGALGSYLPGLAYERAGWPALVGVLLAVGGVGLAIALWLRLGPLQAPEVSA